MNFERLFFCVLCTLCGSAFFPALAFSTPPFLIHDLKAEGNVGHWTAEDLDDDGLRDLVVFHTKGEAGRRERWLSVFRQTPAGFSPPAAFRVDPRAVVFDVGDALPAPGKEIAFLARDGLYAYTGSREEGFPVKILDAPSIFQVPDPSHLAHFDFLLDLNGDGVQEALIPQFDRCLIHARGPDGVLSQSGAVEMGLVPSVQGLPAGREAVGSGVRTGLTTPRFLPLDFNADGRPDLIAVYPDSLCAFLQNANRAFNGRPDRVIDLRFDRVATGSETVREASGGDERDEQTTVTKVADLNGDGRVDLVALKTSTKDGVLRPDTRVQVYYGRDAGERPPFPPSPDQALKVDGTQVLADVVDLDGDGRMDLIVPSIRLGIGQIIQMLISRTLDVDVHIYLMGGDGRYPAAASLRRGFPVQVDFKGHRSQPVYEVEDLNGDGRLDILTSADATELEGYHGDPARIFGKKPDFRFRVKLPGNGERVRALHLDADGRADAVITYGRQDEEEGENLRGTIRILLSNPQ